MAPIELSELSSNWKRLQKRLQATAASKPPPSSPADDAKEKQDSLKRKRSTKSNGTPSHTSSKTVNGSTGKTQTQTPPPKHPQSRKRQKMEEPHSIGASAKRHDVKTLSRSISMPNLKQPSILSSSKAAAESISILTPSPHHPDIENEGISSTALPGKYIALDCEMVGTGPEPDRDSALARVSVVNYHGHQVYDSYVRVKVPVTDYRTAVSGIEPRHLRPDIARPFKEVHDDLKILLEGRILVGHAVKNDLDALLLKHDKRFIRDTSKYSKFREIAMIPGRTPGLKHLAEKLLGVEIQIGSHSSVEDARATMALFRLEKEGFEVEVAKMYGHMRQEVAKEEGVVGEGDTAKKSKNKKKKKKKKN
ncbi:RNA exonuclease 4 [Melanomma pulvis-pyrius CBS 109.77]|uniref:RNA exonuclease 4 n=1 Tax=Melanomma pulvis-pyrius CBS 109.77 TaxID=1314802 RepID=A0A6A6WZQ0_9PLEO|nr:RNA exonuclease 4 [Melanomma pulvis-pyrius CBS 109.77]